MLLIIIIIIIIIIQQQYYSHNAYDNDISTNKDNEVSCIEARAV